jgi:hypothetical protein
LVLFLPLRQIDGPAAPLTNAASPQPTIVAPQVGEGSASLGFELTVTDVHGLKSSDICFVNVTWAGLAPQASAGPNLTAAPGSMVELDGSGSAASNGIASFRWRQTAGAPVTLSDPASAAPSFTFRDGGTLGGCLSFRLVVEDKEDLRSRANKTVNSGGLK